MTKWMQKMYIPFLAILLAGTITACDSQNTSGESENLQAASSGEAIAPAASDQASGTPASQPENIPEISRIKQFCELATVECCDHNVAKYIKYPGTGLEHIGETERTFWIEYTGTAEISFPVDQIQMEQNGTEITITLPKPRVTCRVNEDSWNEDSYVVSQDQWLQKNPITAQDQTKAIKNAQVQMVIKMRGNSSLINTAQLQAQELIKNYIDQIGELTGVTYHITWMTLEEE